MKRLRIGNDISITWNVTKNGESVDLSDKKVYLYFTNPKGREEVNDISISGSTISCTLPGLDQSILGIYTLTADIRDDEGNRIMIKDKCGIFELVGRSCEESTEETDYTIEL